MLFSWQWMQDGLLYRVQIFWYYYSCFQLDIQYYYSTNITVFIFLLHSILFNLNRRRSSKLNITIMYKLLFMQASMYACMYLTLK